MDEIRESLLKLKRIKGSIDYQDMDEIIRPYSLNDEQINELIIWINQNDLNITTSKPHKSGSPYFTDISIYPLLSREEEYELALQVKKGDLIARDKFIKANLRLVVDQTQQYSCEYLTQYDLVQEGNIGLLKAVDRYDPTLGVPFASYSIYWIRKAIIEAINKAQLIRIPQRIYEQLVKIKEIVDEYQQTFNRQPESNEIAEKLGISKERVEQLLSYQVNIRSLDEQIGEKDELLDLIVHNNDDPFILERLFELLQNLPDRQKDIMERYFGLNGRKAENLSQIAEQLGLSKQRVGQLLKQSIEYMKENYDK